MMNYEEFKSEVERRAAEYLPEKYKNSEISVVPMKKINKVYDCLNIFLDTGSNEKDKGLKTAPNIYLNDLYEYYKVYQDIDKVLNIVSQMTIEFFQMGKDIKAFTDDIFSKKDRIIMMLINAEKNKSYLEQMPHIDFLDMAVIFKFLLQAPDGNYGTVPINFNHMKEMGFTEDTLFQKAKENMKNLMPLWVHNLSDLIEPTARRRKGKTEKSPFYVLTNSKTFVGATAMVLYEEEIYKIAQKYDSNLYILPSSIHEIMLVSDKLCSKEVLSRILYDGNRELIKNDDWLSDKIYYYEKDARKISCLENRLS